MKARPEFLSNNATKPSYRAGFYLEVESRRSKKERSGMKPKASYCHREAVEFPVDQLREKNGDVELHAPYMHEMSSFHYWTGEVWKRTTS